MIIEFDANKLTLKQARRVYDLLNKLGKVTPITCKIDGNIGSMASLSSDKRYKK